MRLATIRLDGCEEAAVLGGSVPVPLTLVNRNLGTNWIPSVFDLVVSGELFHMTDWYRAEGAADLESLAKECGVENVTYAPLYRTPGKIWGIGLNYVDHAADLAEKAPQSEPASFMRPASTVVGYGDPVRIPLQSEKTTGEAELGVVFGKYARNVSRERWLDVVAGFVCILDMTAEDILRRNPRYLTRSKSFDTFFSFGPHLVTPDEISDVAALRVATVKNGEVWAENTPKNMMFPPDELVAFHSRVFPWCPGDILSTGTPRAVSLEHGDLLECRITGFEPLRNPVEDLKRL
jgi:2-keto-4-pentenoate hydratase/2-oxohepta-3-ene-1,7-dioic acid hydratase in catechol pathway